MRTIYKTCSTHKIFVTNAEAYRKSRVGFMEGKKSYVGGLQRLEMIELMIHSQLRPLIMTALPTCDRVMLTAVVAKRYLPPPN